MTHLLEISKKPTKTYIFLIEKHRTFIKYKSCFYKKRKTNSID